MSSAGCGGSRAAATPASSCSRTLERWSRLVPSPSFSNRCPPSSGHRVSAELRIPTVGIGAGPGCDAQILVWQDMAGLTAGRLPRFVKRYADLRADLLAAAGRYVADVAGGRHPRPG